MSTTPFQLGEQASASALMQAFNTLRDQGTAALAVLNTYRTLSLADFAQKVEALNSRRQKANRSPVPYTAVNFVTSDFLDIDQTLTSATVRADAEAVTLKERAAATSAVIASQTFSASAGYVESISANNSLYRVESSKTPTGTFALELLEALEMTVLTFDMAATPSTPVFEVSASPDGVSYTSASYVSMNGYRLSAWFAPMKMLYIRLAITPALSDTLGGTSYTFGLTDFVGISTEFQMVSDLVTVPIPFVPAGASLRMSAQTDSGLLCFLSFNGGIWQEYANGDTVLIPGTSSASLPLVALDTVGKLEIDLPQDVYLASIRVSDPVTGDTVPLAPGLSPDDPNIALLTRSCVAVTPGLAPALFYIRSNLETVSPAALSVSYASGAAFGAVQLKVQLTTSDRTVTPVFTGASLQEI